ncbi:MAG: ComF family protein [Chloroflexi bacterium]|nr:ComF family protein [Chloroflexota bacterium]
MDMVRTLRGAAGWGLDLLLPPRCVGCGAGGVYLCQRCLAAAPRLLPPYCWRCAEPLQSRSEGSLLACGRCDKALQAIDGIRAPFLMEGSIREAVHRLKYDGVRALVPALGGLLAEYVRQASLPAQVLVPVPLHPTRERRRGYNQALLLGWHIARELGLPLAAQGLVRARAGAPQARSASREVRRANVAGAFEARRGFERLAVLLVDDVCTTGATLDACAVALKGAGATSVWGVALAREG